MQLPQCYGMDKSLVCGCFILGGQFDTNQQLDNLMQLYHVHLTEAFVGGWLEDKKVQSSFLNYNKASNIMYFLDAIH